MAAATIDQTFQEASRLHRAGRLADAEKLYQQVLMQQADHSDALDGLGVLVLQVGAAPAAMNFFGRAIAVNPNKLPYHVHLAMALSAQGKFDDSVSALTQALAIHRNNPELYFHLGNAFQQAGKIDEAIAAYQKSIELQPKSAEAFNNLAAAFRRQGRNDEALRACQQAIKLRPDFSDAHSNLGNTFQEQGRTNEALASFRKALALNPKSNEAKLAIGMILLREGDFAGGWPAYEARLDRARRFTGPDLPQPRWDGKPLGGKRILLRVEQGLGDTIHFIRYAPLIAERGGRVVLQCQPELRRLLSGQLGIEQIVVKGETPPVFDVHLPLMSLPLAMGTTLKTIPAAMPYLKAEPAELEEWSPRLAEYAGAFKIGLVWSGSPTNRSDYARSIPFELFAPLSRIEGVKLFSVQKGPAAQQTKNPPDGMEIVDWTQHIKDFADTAGLVAGLDLVITVDTSVTHLTGAMGKPIWALITTMPDWRWLLNRDDSPWYPTLRLFRQTTPRDWAEVLKRVELAAKEASAGFLGRTSLP